MPGWALFRGLILSIMKSMRVCWVGVLDMLGGGCVWMCVCCVDIVGCVWLCMCVLGRYTGYVGCWVCVDVCGCVCMSWVGILDMLGVGCVWMCVLCRHRWVFVAVCA